MPVSTSQGQLTPVPFNWSEFWREPGRVSTFTEGPLATSYYQPDRQMRLVHLFDHLARELNSGGHVLDVGCGNGAGAASLLEAADQQHKDLSIIAIDSAQIDPAEKLARRVSFRHGNAENLAFPDRSFELVLSCFSVEFFDVDAFLAECRRVLQPDGRVIFLSFAAESPLLLMQSRYVAVYENGLRQLIDSFQHDQPLNEALTEAVRMNIEQNVPQPHFRQHLHRLVDVLTHRQVMKQTADPLNTPRFADVNEQMNVVSFHELKRWFAWMQVIHHAALDAAKARQLARQMHFAGLDQSRVVPLEFEGRLLCWLFEGECFRTD